MSVAQHPGVELVVANRDSVAADPIDLSADLLPIDLGPLGVPGSGPRQVAGNERLVLEREERLAGRGRMQGKLPARLDAWIDGALRAAPMREAPLTRQVVRALHSITTPHRDPADRFLAATAAS